MSQDEKDRAAFDTWIDRLHTEKKIPLPEWIAAKEGFFAALKYAREEDKTVRDELVHALRRLDRAYVRLLENGRDRITFLGGQCDSVPVMEAQDIELEAARATLKKVTT